MKKVINKGYTITVTSWENDADNYKTKQKTVDTLEEIKIIYKICNELLISGTNNDKGIGNSIDSEYDYRIEEYIEDNPELNLTEEYIRELAYLLLGSSEFYDYRVFESCEVFYSPEDIYCEEITF